MLGDVFVGSEPGDKGVRLRVVLFQRDFVDISGVPVELARASKKTHHVCVTPIPGRAQSLSLVRVSADPAGLTFKTAKQDNGSVQIEVSANDSTPPGYFLVKCCLKSDTRGKSVCSFGVRVKE